MTYHQPPRRQTCDICGDALPKNRRTTCHKKWCQTEHLRMYHITRYHELPETKARPLHRGPAKTTKLLEYR